jgi:hypothetical protein
MLVNIGTGEKTLSFRKKLFSSSRNSTLRKLPMMTKCKAAEGFEISPRFRSTIEQRILRLERDAEQDEAQVARLEDGDHIRRQMRLVFMQKAEALRMRLFLDGAKVRLPRPLIAL